MRVKTLSLTVLLTSLMAPVGAQISRPMPQTVGPPPSVAVQRAAPRSVPGVVNVPSLHVTGTALNLPLVVAVPAFDVTGAMLKLPITVSVPAFDVTGAMLKLPLVVTVPAFAVTGNYKP